MGVQLAARLTAGQMQLPWVCPGYALSGQATLYYAGSAGRSRQESLGLPVILPLPMLTFPEAFAAHWPSHTVVTQNIEGPLG